VVSKDAEFAGGAIFDCDFRPVNDPDSKTASTS
jgi:hypothetical protein